MNEDRTITTADGEMGVVVSHPEGDGPFPVVVLFHHGPGMDEGSRELIQMISDAGYYVIGPDRYYRHGHFIVMDMHAMSAPDADPEESKRFMDIFIGTTDDMMERDVQAVLEYLKTDPAAKQGPMGCIGYCIGARTVLRTIASHPDVFRVGVGLHPSLCTTADDDSPHLAVSSYPGRLYLGFGSLDQMQPASANQPLMEATNGLGDRGIAEVHEGADHGFGVPGGSYHEKAAGRSYEVAFEMFEKELV
ncbi:MAG: dienelactone hydrolase family protein [Acidimicrobiales bacterium]